MRRIEWTLFWRQAIVPFVRRLARRHWMPAFRYLWLDGRSILIDRLWPDEAQLFGPCLPTVRAARDRLFLQADLARCNRRFGDQIRRYGLTSKADFAAFCDKHALPHPPTVLLDRDFPSELGSELFVKRARGSSATGAFIARRSDDAWQTSTIVGNVGSAGGQTVAAGVIRPGLVAQPLLRNRADLARHVGATLATFRIVSAGTAGRQSVVLSALLELPLDETEPLALRWLTLPLDVPSGRIGSIAADATGRTTRYAGLSDSLVPGSDELFALAARAHDLVAATSPVPLPPTIGWDAALTDSGPVLLEMNWNWAVAPHYCNGCGHDPAASDLFAAACR